MAENLLKKYLGGGMMEKKNKMGMGGSMPGKKVIIMQEGGQMEEQAPMEEGAANPAEQILMQLVQILQEWEKGEYESDEEKANMLAQAVAALIQSYVQE